MRSPGKTLGAVLRGPRAVGSRPWHKGRDLVDEGPRAPNMILAAIEHVGAGTFLAIVGASALAASLACSRRAAGS